jgi:hypothetical protein
MGIQPATLLTAAVYAVKRRTGRAAGSRLPRTYPCPNRPLSFIHLAVP